jgi:hypothetical protein
VTNSMTSAGDQPVLDPRPGSRRRGPAGVCCAKLHPAARLRALVHIGVAPALNGSGAAGHRLTGQILLPPSSRSTRGKPRSEAVSGSMS